MMSVDKIIDILKSDVKVIAQELLIAFEKNPVGVDEFVQTMQPKIEDEKNKLSLDQTKQFLGGEIEVTGEDERSFCVHISYYIQNNKGEILELSKSPMRFKKHILIESEFLDLAKNPIKYPIN